jgi:hypothetical protein
MKHYKTKILFIFAVTLILAVGKTLAQPEPGEKILYYQMEPFDDSLFIKIQKEVFIDPPDPKAEIIVDLRDPNNQTVSIKGTLYPFLAFTPETRAKIITYPYKINLEENINFGSVFLAVIEKIHINKIFSPPTAYQISSTLGYINPFLQIFGGEQLGIPIKQDIGLSFGTGTPYSGPTETNVVQGTFHLLGLSLGIYGPVNELASLKSKGNQNNIYFTDGFDVSYVIPFGNFFEVSYLKSTKQPTNTQIDYFTRADTKLYKAKIVDGSYVNWELRYPIKVLGSTRAKFYVSQYVNEWHVGFTGRELSVAGSTFDFRFDAMPHSDVRNPEYVLEVMVQKIAESWGFSAFALGPSVVFSKDTKGNFGVLTLFLNMRLKVGSSL